MKYFSEKLNKTFDTEQACIDAEKAYEDAQTESSKEKKKLSKAIETARETTNDKYKIYCEVVEKAKLDLADYKAELQKKIKEAYDEYNAANEEQSKAIMEFNKKFGPYKTILTNAAGDTFVREFFKFFF